MLMRMLAALTAAALLLANAAPAVALTRDQEREVQLGDQVYRQLESRGKILHDSPYYRILTPLGQRIAAAAGRQYFAPFRFILVHDKQPNAFAVPGGNVYVTDALMTFVQNKEELAGVLCHETSHTIHHDVYDLYAKNQRVSLWALLAQLLIGQRSQTVSTAIDVLANVQVLRFSRDVERSADLTGAYTCAHAGMTPWGMVWMMQRFLDTSKANPPEFLSDHPTDSHRIADLRQLFAGNPQTFARFNADMARATPLSDEGLRNQYVAQTPRVTPARAAAAVRPRAKPTCPPGWKFCPAIP